MGRCSLCFSQTIVVIFSSQGSCDHLQSGNCTLSFAVREATVIYSYGSCGNFHQGAAVIYNLAVVVISIQAAVVSSSLGSCYHWVAVVFAVRKHYEFIVRAAVSHVQPFPVIQVLSTKLQLSTILGSRSRSHVQYSEAAMLLGMYSIVFFVVNNANCGSA